MPGERILKGTTAEDKGELDKAEIGGEFGVLQLKLSFLAFIWT